MSGQVMAEALSEEETHSSEIQQGVRHEKQGQTHHHCHREDVLSISPILTNALDHVPRLLSCFSRFPCSRVPWSIACYLFFFPVSLLPFPHKPLAFSLLTPGLRGACPGPGHGWSCQSCPWTLILGLLSSLVSRAQSFLGFPSALSVAPSWSPLQVPCLCWYPRSCSGLGLSLSAHFSLVIRFSLMALNPSNLPVTLNFCLHPGPVAWFFTCVSNYGVDIS